MGNSEPRCASASPGEGTRLSQESGTEPRKNCQCRARAAASAARAGWRGSTTPRGAVSRLGSWEVGQRNGAAAVRPVLSATMRCSSTYLPAGSVQQRNTGQAVPARARSQSGRSPGALGRAWTGAPLSWGQEGARGSWRPLAAGCLPPRLAWLTLPEPSELMSPWPATTNTGGRVQGREGNAPVKRFRCGSLSPLPKSLHKAIRQGAGTRSAAQAPMARRGWRSRTARGLPLAARGREAAIQRLLDSGVSPVLTAEDSTLAP